MKKLRGFKLGRKLVKVFKWMITPRSRNYRNGFLTAPYGNHNLLSRIRSFARFLPRGTKRLCNSRSDPGYVQLGEEGVKRVGVPKGHLSVYVGESEGATTRVVVPVIYFNHPLFGELLKEAERVHGFNHSGGIALWDFGV